MASKKEVKCGLLAVSSHKSSFFFFTLALTGCLERDAQAVGARTPAIVLAENRWRFTWRL